MSFPATDPHLLEPYLEDLEQRLDPDTEQRHFEAWKRFLDGELEHGVFTPPRREPAPPRIDWPTIPLNDALDNVDLTVLRELKQVSDVLAVGGSAVLNVRANYGVVIITSQYGAEIVRMAPELNTLPTVRPLGSREALKRAVAAGVPDLESGEGAKVFATGVRFVEVQKQYPKIGRWVEVYHPDLQGPIDNIELLWGSDMFLGFYEEPQLMRELLEMVTTHLIAFFRAWFELVPPRSEYAAHWGLRFKGGPMLRNDSLMNLSPDMYVDFVRDHDQKVFAALGGEGAIHFCGRGDHFIEPMAEMQGLTAVNLSQPELNDMDTIFRHTVDKGIKIIGLREDAAVAAGRDLRGQVQV